MENFDDFGTQPPEDLLFEDHLLNYENSDSSSVSSASEHLPSAPFKSMQELSVVTTSPSTSLAHPLKSSDISLEAANGNMHPASGNNTEGAKPQPVNTQSWGVDRKTKTSENDGDGLSVLDGASILISMRGTMSLPEKPVITGSEPRDERIPDQGADVRLSMRASLHHVLEEGKDGNGRRDKKRKPAPDSTGTKESAKLPRYNKRVLMWNRNHSSTD